ncbi:hypothetical protein QJS04_geneDACA016810 [Acorus gramineus]|uniref:Uncharacterized protein n=1 Tax=Acorus gramineus TaxID=55184 RepID=A0AAV8ZYT0_ACOGR|nr:hypothetical protein QJS04_geneDACA016810 [Acorus gramineus]
MWAEWVTRHYLSKHNIWMVKTLVSGSWSLGFDLSFGHSQEDLPRPSVVALIHQGRWSKPAWWSSGWDSLWTQISEMECGGPGVDSLIWPHSILGSPSTTNAWRFLRALGVQLKWAKWI